MKLVRVKTVARVDWRLCTYIWYANRHAKNSEAYGDPEIWSINQPWPYLTIEFLHTVTQHTCVGESLYWPTISATISLLISMSLCALLLVIPVLHDGVWACSAADDILPKTTLSYLTNHINIGVVKKGAGLKTQPEFTLRVPVVKIVKGWRCPDT